MVPLPTKDKKSLIDLIHTVGPSSIRMMTRPPVVVGSMVSRNVLGHGIAEKKALSEPQQVKRAVRDYKSAAQPKYVVEEEDSK